MIPLLRTMTRKSILKYGKFSKYTVQHIIDLRRKDELVWVYFMKDAATFTEDILEELGITKEYKIDKPGIDEEMLIKLREDKGRFRKHQKKFNLGLEQGEPNSRNKSKARLRSDNQNYY